MTCGRALSPGCLSENKATVTKSPILKWKQSPPQHLEHWWSKYAGYFGRCDQVVHRQETPSFWGKIISLGHIGLRNLSNNQRLIVQYTFRQTKPPPYATRWRSAAQSRQECPRCPQHHYGHAFVSRKNVAKAKRKRLPPAPDRGHFKNICFLVISSCSVPPFRNAAPMRKWKISIWIRPLKWGLWSLCVFLPFPDCAETAATRLSFSSKITSPVGQFLKFKLVCWFQPACGSISNISAYPRAFLLRFLLPQAASVHLPIFFVFNTNIRSFSTRFSVLLYFQGRYRHVSGISTIIQEPYVFWVKLPANMDFHCPKHADFRIWGFRILPSD